MVSFEKDQESSIRIFDKYYPFVGNMTQMKPSFKMTLVSGKEPPAIKNKIDRFKRENFLENDISPIPEGKRYTLYEYGFLPHKAYTISMVRKRDYIYTRDGSLSYSYELSFK